MVEKAKEITGDLGEKLNATIEHANEMNDKMNAEDAAKGEFADTTLKEKLNEHDESMLEGKDDFFSNAAKFADGEYDAFSDDYGKAKIVDNPDPSSVIDKTDDGKTVPGFEDLDGDGNEIVDDAIIDDDPSA